MYYSPTEAARLFDLFPRGMKMKKIKINKLSINLGLN